LTEQRKCPNCNGSEFAEGDDFMPIKPIDKKMSFGSPKVYTFCLNCGEVISIRVKNSEMFRS